MTTTLPDRIRQILRDTGRNQKQLADDARVSKGLVTQWLNDAVQTVNIEAARNIGRVHGYNPAWVMLGELPEKGPDTTFKEKPRSPDIGRLMAELEDVEAMGPQWADLAQAITALVRRLKDAQRIARHEHLTPEMRAVVEKLCEIDRKGGDDRDHALAQITRMLAGPKPRAIARKQKAS